ncbi:TPA: glycosyltransferase [Raoultella planticola]|uniref:glycosyltransferase n=2 Tax=Raoultella planticola TaxID=575 RepID=UPI0015F14926|nr:glycosyltransferase [Raoultella planticola]MDY7626512.1 glycosyltransferase [Raoultella planticola]
MIVCLICESTATGTLAMVRIIANGMVDRGNIVHLLYSTRTDTPENLEEMFNGVVLHHIQMDPKNAISGLLAIRKKVKVINPDIVHLHSSIAGFLGRLSLIGFNNPSIFYSPHCISFMRKDINKFKRYAFILLERVSCIRKSTYLACSRSELSVIEKELRENVLLIENAIELESFQGNRPGVKNSNASIIVVNVGGIRKQKDPSLFSNIARKFKNKNVQFIWIGDGDENLKSELIESGVSITGWLQQGQIKEYYDKADIFLSTSQWEGLPVAVIEAMASGLCIVANSCEGNVDLINDNFNGLLFDGSVADGYEKLSRSIDESIDRTRMSRQAQDDSIQRFDKKIFLDKLDNIYQKIR